MATVLIVDDDDTIRDSLYELISEEHTCHAAETAEKALEWLDKEVYDVVLTDISMPGLSGVEFLGQVRHRYPDTPVIVITGINDKGHSEGLLKLGAFDYLLKPFRLEDVEQSVKRAIDHRNLRIQSITGTDDQ